MRGIPTQAESDALQNLIQHVREVVESCSIDKAANRDLPKIVPFLQSELGAPLPLHVSLSRTLQIKTEDRNEFLETLRSCLRKAAVRSFHLKFHNLKWVSNSERNRWFLVLGIEKPTENELNRLLSACNQATCKCGHPALYTGSQGDGPMEDNTVRDDSKKRKIKAVEEDEDDRSDRFHISIAWNLEEPDSEWTSIIKTLDVGKYLNTHEAIISTVKARIGNVVHKIDLSAGRSGRGTKRGIMGLG
jgi:hypothetical protein